MVDVIKQYKKALAELEKSREDIEKELINANPEYINLKNGQWRYIKWSFLPPLSSERLEQIEKYMTEPEPQWDNNNFDRLVRVFFDNLSKADDIYDTMTKEYKEKYEKPRY